MREYHRSRSYHRCGRKRSKSKDRGRDRERDKDKDRKLNRKRQKSNREERHSRDHHNYKAVLKKRHYERRSHDCDKRSNWDHDRNGSSDERDYYYDSKTHKSKSRTSKQTKNLHHRQSSTSSSSSTSSLSSVNSRHSRNSYSSQLVKQLRRDRSNTRESSLDGKTLGSKTLSKVITPKEIDLLDGKVQKALEKIEENAFIQGVFYKTKYCEAPTTQRSSLSQEKTISGDKVIIDLNAETVTFPKPPETLTNIPNNEKSEIFHPNFIGDIEEKQGKWIRKLYLYRQKYMKQ